MGNTQHKLSQFSKKSEAEASTFDCQICLEPTSPNKIFKFKKKKTCFHIFCNDCVAKYIKAKIEENVGNIRCPGMNCGKLLDPLACRHIIQQKLFDRWCELLCYLTVLGHEICYCPYPDCSALVANECGGATRKSECPNCKKLFCFSCEIPWHEGFLCNKRKETIDINDILFAEVVKKKKFARCPVCYIFVEPTTSFYIITCRCKVLFCCYCGRKRDQTHCGCKKATRDDLCFVLILNIFLICLIVIGSVLF